MRTTAILCSALAIAAVARAQAPSSPPSPSSIERLADGAPLYVMLRPGPVAALLGRLGIDRTEPVVELKERFGLDVVNPALLAPTGLDGGAPIAASLFEPVANTSWFHHRVTATVADPARLQLLVEGMASSKSKQVIVYAPGSPEAKAGILASSTMWGIAVLRLAGDRAVLDVAQPWDGKPPAPLALARRFPLDGKPMTGAAAKKLIAGDPALAVYVDGRRLPQVMAPLAVFGAYDAAGRARARREGAACAKAWATAPAVFDDAALTVVADAQGMTIKLGFGETAPLALPVADDGAIELDTLARSSLALATVQMPGFAALQALPRRGPLAGSSSAVTDAANRCKLPAWAQLAVRHWPQLAGLAVDDVAASTQNAVGLQALVAGARNQAVLLREADGDIKWAFAGTFEPGARPALELIASQSGPSQATKVGGRSPSVYPHHIAGAKGGVIALEGLASGRALVVVAEGAPTLGWVYEAAPGPRAPPSLLRLRADVPRLLKLVPLDGTAGDLLGHLGLVEGRLADEGDVVVLTLRAALP